ncbi:MAG: efflux RND transporter periplasmic adaptor subunit [Proteobacteria bacterium]|nr:efflux RND transporter periplasmic adaptor subunit [Pseudomonadota bacterium]HQR04626.1 efflux RND transporter periplasmic adaptor subunit [Rhodocyclaceae bacterium]
MTLRGLRVSAFALALLGLVILGFRYATRPAPIAVTIASADPGPVETTVANTRAGSVAACRRAKVAPPAAGRIARLPIHKGQRVEAGTLLLELWNDDVVAREQLARDQLVTARTRVTEACQLTAAAVSEARQTRALRDKGFVSEERAIRAEAQARSSQATCAAVQAQVREARARVAAARADTERTILRAPFAGVVAEINGERGEYLTPSPPGIPTLPAVDLIDDTCLYVTAPIDEVDAARLRTGLAARITLDAYRNRHFQGHVRRIAPYVLALEKQARTVEVEVAFDNPRPGDGIPLLVGYSADIEIITERRDAVLRIPTSALMPGNRVLLLGSDGILSERVVGIGLSNWEFTEIRNGLQRGDQVITSLDRDGVKAGARAVAENKQP